MRRWAAPVLIARSAPVLINGSTRVSIVAAPSDNVGNRRPRHRVLVRVSTSSEPSLERRAFLGVAAGGVAAIAAPAVARAASHQPAHPTRPAAPTGVAARSSGPTPADWTALAHDLAGPLVRPGEASYPVDSHLFDPRFDGLRPAGIAYVKNAHDVGTCLAFVRKYGVKFATRSGGHSYAGWSSSNGGLIIDVQNLKGVQVSGSTAVVGAGTRLIDFYNGLAAHGRAVPGGSCPTVGIAGLTLGGGIGVTSRAYGLTCDKLASLTIITADGKALTASPDEHPDLYWACRGGGGGNFGIATWFHFNSVPAPTPVVFFLSWPWSKAAKVIAAWQSWAPNAPDELWSNLHLSAAPGGHTPTIQVGGCYLDGISGAANLIDQLYAKVGSQPVQLLPQPVLLPERDAGRGGLLYDRPSGLPLALVRRRRRAEPPARAR